MATNKEQSQLISDHAVRLATMETKLDRVLGVCERVDKYLFTGNGVPPMTERVRVLEDGHRLIIQNKEGRAAFWTSTISAIISSVVAAAMIYKAGFS